MFKFRLFAVVLVVGVLLWLAGPLLLKGMVLERVNSTFTAFGFPDPRYDVIEFTWTSLKLANVQLEPEGISTIDEIDVNFTPLDLFEGRATRIAIINPDIIEDMTDEIGPGGFTRLPDFLARFSLQNIPAETLSVNNLNITFASDDLSPSVQGKINLLTDSDGTRKLSLLLESEQKDLSLKASGQMTEDRSGLQKMTFDIPEARFELPGLRLSRANAKFIVSRKMNGPLAIEGELEAGAFKIGTLPLDGITLVASGQKPDLSIIGNATITGMPLTNLSLRLAEDAKGATALLQLSGESPQGLRQQIFPALNWPLPEQQKYALAIEFKNSDLFRLVKGPYQGGLFVYLNDPSPIFSAALNCRDLLLTCTARLPKTTTNVAQLAILLGPLLAADGLEMSEGEIDLSVAAQSWHDEKDKTLTGKMGIEATGKNIKGNWRGIPYSAGVFDFVRQDSGDIKLMNTRLDLLGGHLQIPQMDMAANGTGQAQLNFSAINLKQASKIANISGLTLSGQADAKAQMTWGPKGVTLQEGTLLTAKNGVFAYQPDLYPGFLDGKEPYQQALREALKNYSFDTLTVTATGLAQRALVGKMSASGKNPALFEGRTVMLDLDFNTPAARGLMRLAPNVSPE